MTNNIDLPVELFNKLMPDIPTVWEIVRKIGKLQHHEECSFRVSKGGLICDCAGFDAIYAYAEILRPLITQSIQEAVQKEQNRTAFILSTSEYVSSPQELLAELNPSQTESVAPQKEEA